MSEGLAFIDNENVHEITVGINPKDDIRFTVGRTYMEGTPHQRKVVAIEFDHNMLVQYGTTRAVVWVEDIDGEIKQWKDLIGIPLTITSK